MARDFRNLGRFSSHLGETGGPGRGRAIMKLELCQVLGTARPFGPTELCRLRRGDGAAEPAVPWNPDAAEQRRRRRQRRSTRSSSSPMEPRRSHGPGSAGRYPRAAQPQRPGQPTPSQRGRRTSHGEPGRSRGRRLRPSSNGGDCGGAVVPLKNIKRFCVVQMSTRLRSPLFPSLPVYLPFTTGPPPIHYGSESGR